MSLKLDLYICTKKEWWREKGGWWREKARGGVEPVLLKGWMAGWWNYWLQRRQITQTGRQVKPVTCSPLRCMLLWQIKKRKKKFVLFFILTLFFYNTRNDLSRFFFSHAYSVFFIFFNYYFYRSMRASLSPPHNNNSLAPPCHTLFRQSGDQSEKNLYIVRGGACLQYMGKG